MFLYDLIDFKNYVCCVELVQSKMTTMAPFTKQWSAMLVSIGERVSESVRRGNFLP